MDELLKLRQQYGSVYVATLPDGRRVPYKLLSIGDWMEYDRLLLSGLYPRSVIEDEIFKKCVLDKGLIDYFNLLKAGDVTSVVGTILYLSGPQGTEQLVQDLNRERQKVSAGIHEMVGLICQAFPAYKPEEVYQFQYETFVLRLAQAEHKLVATGILKEPLQLVPPEKPNSKQRKPISKEEMLGIKDKFDKQQFTKPETVKMTPFPPLPQEAPKQVVITRAEMEEGNTALGPSHDKIQMAKITKDLYPEYLQQIREGKPVRILTPEERLANAQARIAARDAKLKEALAQEKIKFKEDLQKGLAEKKKAIAKKQRRRPR